MAIELKPDSTISVGASRILSIDLQKELTGDEVLTGTPTITEASGVLTLTNKAVSTAALTINGRACAIGKAVQCLVNASAAVAGTTYTLTISVATDSSPAETLAYTHDVVAT